MYKLKTYLTHGQIDTDWCIKESRDIQTNKDAVAAFVIRERAAERVIADDIGCLHITGLHDIKLEDYKNILYTRSGETATVGYRIEERKQIGGLAEDLSIYVRGLGYSYLDTCVIGHPILAHIVSVEHKGKVRWYVLYKTFGRRTTGLGEYHEIKAKDIIKKLWLNS